jgi:hypothetical protein
MKARHIALIADSCFSGDFLNPTRGIAPTITNTYFKNAYSRISRQVLTSGASEAVPDESQFTRQLKLALEGNTSPYLDPLMLYNQIRLGVTQTTPLLGDLKDSGHQEGSSFLLFLKAKQSMPPVATSSTQTSKSSFELEKTTANVSVVVKTSGTLLLDGIVQGQIPAGRIAAIKNLESGKHELTMQYENGETEKIPLDVESDAPVSVTFTSVFVASSAQTSVVPESQASPTVQSDSLQNGDTLPRATIKIDGNFDDWNGVLPAFISGTSSTAPKNLAIDKMFLAADEKNLYIKFDIADSTPSSLFHSNNFDESHNSNYICYLSRESNVVSAHITYDNSPNGNRWYAEVYEKGFGARWKLIERGNYSMKGSSAEISFPLKPILGILGVLAPGEHYTVWGETGYLYDAGRKWHSSDETSNKQINF